MGTCFLCGRGLRSPGVSRVPNIGRDACTKGALLAELCPWLPLLLSLGWGRVQGLCLQMRAQGTSSASPSLTPCSACRVLVPRATTCNIRCPECAPPVRPRSQAQCPDVEGWTGDQACFAEKVGTARKKPWPPTPGVVGAASSPLGGVGPGKVSSCRSWLAGGAEWWRKWEVSHTVSSILEFLALPPTAHTPALLKTVVCSQALAAPFSSLLSQAFLKSEDRFWFQFLFQSQRLHWHRLALPHDLPSTSQTHL